MLFPVISKGLVEFSIFFLADVIRISGPDGLGFVKLFIFSVFFLNCLFLLFVLFFVCIFIFSYIFNLWFFAFFFFLLFFFLFIIRNFLVAFLFDQKFDWITNELGVL